MEPKNEDISKITLCVLLTQFGKTFTAISKILAHIEQDNEFGRSVHVIFTMNTLLNNSQFVKRLEVIEKQYGENSICVISSKDNNNNDNKKYIHVKTLLELQGLCYRRSTCPRVVIMCSNSRRFDDGVEFLKILNEEKCHIDRAFAYYDELHKYLSDNLRFQIEKINSFDIVKCITGLTASPDNIWQESGFWSKIRLIQLDDFSSDNYVGYKDMIFNCIDDVIPTPYIRPKAFDFDKLDEDTLSFIRTVLQRYPDILGNGTRSFIPAHVRRKGHVTVRNLIFEKNEKAVVVVLNGVEKTLQYKTGEGNTKTIALASSEDELCETVSKLVIKHDLVDRPLVITGLLCVGMGQTLTHKSMGSFTSAIFSHMDLTNDDIYQLFGRITGRMKNWGDKFVQTNVYCPTVIMNRCIVMEDCARNMAKEHNGKLVTQKDYRVPMTKSVVDNIRSSKQPKKPKAIDTDKEYKVFVTQSEAIEFAAKDPFKHTFYKRREPANAPTTLKDKFGNNPTIQYIIDRWWGIDDISKIRMVPTDKGEWCVYWRPSTFA